MFKKKGGMIQCLLLKHCQPATNADKIQIMERDIAAVVEKNSVFPLLEKCRSKPETKGDLRNLISTNFHQHVNARIHLFGEAPVRAQVLFLL